MHDFSVSSIFMSLRTVELEELDHRILQIEPRLGLISQTGAMRLLLELLPSLSEDPMLHYAVYKLLERLTALSHRNKVILSNLGLLGTLFKTFVDPQTELHVSKQERRVMQKLLRRIMDLGASATEVREIFRSAVSADDKLNLHVLDVLRSGMKARWPDHFSLERRAAIIFSEDGIKGLPSNGFTFMVRVTSDQ
jgi:hypothetical protein